MENLVSESAQRLFCLGELDGADCAADSEIQRASELGNIGDLWRARLIKADVLAARGHLEPALKYLESLQTPDDVEWYVEFMLRRGEYLGALGRCTIALQVLNEAEVRARNANILPLVAGAYLRRAFIFFAQKDYVSSEYLYRAVLGIADKIDGWYFRGNALWGIGKNLMIQGSHQEAIPWLSEALAIFEAANARLSVAMVWGELAVCQLGLGNDQAAVELNLKAADVEREAGYVHNYQVSLANIGNVYLHRRDYLTALSYYQRAISLAREIKDPVSVKKWTYNINLTYAKIRAQVDQEHPRSIAEPELLGRLCS